MWDYRLEERPREQAVKFFILENGSKLTFSKVIEQWKVSEQFRRFYNSILADASFAAFFWETPPLSVFNKTKTFEFVLVNSDSLTRIKPNPKPFQTYFEDEKEVVSFSNLSGDAHLIVPCPRAALECYSHLAAFVRKAPEHQRNAFWKSIGEEYEKRINGKPLWLSTAGLGVSWLHMRIDSQPKYYRYLPYEQVDE